MFITDPDTTPAADITPDPAAAAAEAPTDDAGGMLEAITADLPEGAENAAALPEDLVPGSNEAAEAAAAKDAEAGKAGEPVKDADGKPVEAKAEPDEAAKEADTLGLKGKANERFREMAAEIKELAPLRDALKEAGIKDVAELPVLAKRAKDGDDLVHMVSETGASPEQFGMTLDYLAVAAKANAGDRAAAEQAFKFAQAEVAGWAQKLGIEVPGVHDPLAEHADLKAKIEAGDMTREAAMEVAQARASTAALAQRNADTERATATTQAQQQAVQQGVDALKAWEAPKLADPAYAAVRPALNAKVLEIRQKYPPSLWAEATELAYQALAAEAKAAAVPPKQPVPGPVRPGGPRPAMVPTTDDPYEAMLQGIAAATP